MKTGLVIKELRIKKGLTQEELAARTELSARTIQRKENGEVDPRAYSLQMIAKALDVDFSLFVEGEPEDDLKIEAKNDRLFLGLIHLSTILPLFFPSILIWNNKKHKVKGITTHFNEVMGFQLTIWLMFIFPGVVMHYFFSMNTIINRAGFLVFIGIAPGIVYSVMNIVNVMNGKLYKRFGFLNPDKE